jgi:hypothetical protein
MIRKTQGMLVFVRNDLRRPGILVVLVTLVAHFGFFLRDPSHLTNDGPSYLSPAAHMLAGDGFLDAEGAYETRRTPGYPAAIAVVEFVGGGVGAIVVLQHLLCAALAAAVFVAAFVLTGKRGPAVIAGVLWGSDLPSIECANNVLTETLSALLICAIVYGIYRLVQGTRRPLAVAGGIGLLVGVLTVTRPIGMVYFVPLAIFLAIGMKPRRIVVPAVFALAAVLLPAAWGYRNLVRAGAFTLSSLGGDNMLLFRAAGALAAEAPGSFDENFLRYQSELAREEDREIQHDLGERAKSLSDAQRASYASKLGVEIVSAHPKGLAIVLVRGVAFTLIGGGAQALSTLTGLAPRVCQRILAPYTLLLLVLAIVGAWRLWATNRMATALLVITIAYFVVIGAGMGSYSRFRVPVAPLYSVLAAAGAWRVVERVRARRAGAS